MNMTIGAAMVRELDQEMSGVRKMLAGIPVDKLDWRPHEKSMSFLELMTHLANLPSWTVNAVNQDSFDLAPVDGDPPRTTPVTSVAAALETFDKNVADARSAIEGTDDDHLRSPWTLLSGGNTLFTMPRSEVVGSMVIHHAIHHRAQLGLYLRLNQVEVPAVYGPTADSKA